MKQTVFVVLAVLALLGLLQSVERHALHAAETAPVASGTGLTILAGPQAAPLGSCVRCGRDVFSPTSNRNSALRIHDVATGRVRWSGCFACLYEILDHAEPKETK